MRAGIRFLLLTLAGDKGTRTHGILVEWGEKAVTTTLRFPNRNHSKKLQVLQQTLNYFCYILVEVPIYEEVETADTTYEFFLLKFPQVLRKY